VGGEIESGINKEFLNKNVCINMDYFINNPDNTRTVFDLILELSAFDQNNNIECEFATFCRFYRVKDNFCPQNNKFELQIQRQKFKFQGEWYAIHDAFGLGGSNSEEKYFSLILIFTIFMEK
jgi:hypothetical protein